MSADRLYVDGGVAASGSGASWSQATRTIGEAISLSAYGRAGEIWVAEGTYHEAIRFTGTPSPLALYGGFSGDETTLTERNIAAHRTIIDASTADNGNPAAHAVELYGQSAIDGFTVTGGKAAGGDGGGIWCHYEFDINRRIANCTITSNTATERGGGIYVTCATSVENCVISDNSARDGGGIYLSLADLALTNSIISNNYASRWGGGTCNPESSLYVTNCTFYGNKSDGIWSGSAPTIRNTIFSNNSGYAYNNWFGSYNGPILRHNLFFGNSDGDYRCDIDVGSVRWNSGAELVLPMAQGNLVGDPLFVNAHAGDFRLSAGSAAVDRGLLAGSPLADLAGNPRPGSDGLVDIGAYEAPSSWQAPKDHEPPASRLQPLPSRINFATVDISYRAGDARGSVRTIDLYYRKDKGTWLKYNGPTGPSPIVFDSRSTGGDGLYEFYSIATDENGNREAPKQSAEAATFIASAGGPIHVDCGVTTSGAGTGWANAYKTIGEAMAVTTTGTQIWVANGIYPEKVTFKTGRALYGGFNKTETNPSQRDVVKRNDLLTTPPSFEPGTQVLGVVMDAVSSATLDGFTVAYGSGIACYGTGAGSLITNCTVRNNDGTTGGDGGIRLVNSRIVVLRCMIRNNSTGRTGLSGGGGGGIWASGDNCLVSGCSILGNKALSGWAGPGGDMDNIVGGKGGGIYAEGGTFVNCFVEGNLAEKGYNPWGWFKGRQPGQGGAAYALGAKFQNCTFRANSGECGGMSANSKTVCRNSIFSDNTSTMGLSVNAIAGSTDHCLFWQDPFISGSGNTAGDPRFTGDGYEIGVGSAAIDTGSSITLSTLPLPVTVDIEGFPRPLDVAGVGTDGPGQGFDIGAFEFRGSLNVHDLSRATYELGILRAGRNVYTDRAYNFTAPVPEFANGSLYLMGRNDDKKLTSDPFLTFWADSDVTVYIAFDERKDSIPAWLKPWKKKEGLLMTTDPGSASRTIYAKDFSKGLVSLGPNREKDQPTSRSLYTVILRPKVTATDHWEAYR